MYLLRERVASKPPSFRKKAILSALGVVICTKEDLDQNRIMQVEETPLLSPNKNVNGCWTLNVFRLFGAETFKRSRKQSEKEEIGSKPICCLFL